MQSRRVDIVRLKVHLVYDLFCQQGQPVTASWLTYEKTLSKLNSERKRQKKAYQTASDGAPFQLVLFLIISFLIRIH